jgi:hypothetical protein
MRRGGRVTTAEPSKLARKSAAFDWLPKQWSSLQGFLMELPALVACYQHERYVMLLQDFCYRRDPLALQVYIKHRNVWPFARQRPQRLGDGRSRFHHDAAMPCRRSSNSTAAKNSSSTIKTRKPLRGVVSGIFHPAGSGGGASRCNPFRPNGGLRNPRHN